MRQSTLTNCSLLMLAAVLFAGDTCYGNPESDTDLTARVAQLERRVAELERALQGLAKPAAAPLTQTEAKLLGTWSIVEDDKRLTSFPDMKFAAGGKCAVVYNARPAEKNAAQHEIPLDAKYQVIGTQLSIEHRFQAGGGIGGVYRISSLTDQELVLSSELEGQTTKLRYERAK